MKRWCRIYGRDSLRKIFEEWRVEKREFYRKVETANWKQVLEEEAASIEATPLNYALALFVLAKAS